MFTYLTRYQSLAEPSQIRRDNLEDALQLYQYYRDAEDELLWLHDKMPSASSTDLGSSLTQAQNLLKKHTVSELCSCLCVQVLVLENVFRC